MHIEDKEIKRIVSNEKEYRFAYFLNIDDILERMTVSLDENNGCYRINARIHEKQNSYILSIKVNAQGEIIYVHCGCPYASSQSACRHIGAILLFLKKTEITSFPYFYEKDKDDKILKYRLLEQQKQERILKKKQSDSVQLIELYKERLLRESKLHISSSLYQLKVFIKKEKSINMTLKVVHLGQAYVVKNIETFLHAIDNHETLKYSRYLEFIHSVDAFDADSQDIISFVRECFLKNQAMQNGIIKELKIDDSMLDSFYQFMEALPSQYCDIAFMNKTEPVPLEITDKEDSYILDFENYNYVEGCLLSPTCMYDLSNDTMYRYVYDEQGHTVLLMKKLLESQGGMYIPHDMIHDFYKYVLIDIMDHISLDTKLFQDYHQENMINLYVDMTSQEQLCLQLEYLYDENLTYGFDESNPYISKEADLIENYIRPYVEDIDSQHMIYLEYNHDFTYFFIKEGLSYLSNYCQVFVSEALNQLSFQNDIDLKVGIHISHHLLEIQIDSIHIQKDELYDVLKAYKKKRKFYKLKNGKFLSLESEQFKEFDKLASSLQVDLSDLSKEKLSIPIYRLFDINALSQRQNKLQYEKSEEFQKFVDAFYHPQQFEVPQKYQSILRQYQIDGYQWLCLMEHYGFSGILADDMGLGKTLQMIVYLETMKKHHLPSLVITPASLLLNWQDEIQKFASSLRVLCVMGTKNERDELIKTVSHYDVIITSYDYIRRDIEEYEDMEFHTIVLDEAQYIKNPKTRNAICVKQLKSKQRFALTGTPIENSLAEIWSIFDFLMPYYLYNYSYFSQHYEKPIIKDHDEDKEHQLREMIAPFILRRNKKDVLKELPDKIEKTMYFQMNEEEEKIYISHLVQVNKTLQEKLDVHQLGKIDILSMLTRLRQLCQDPRLLYEDIETPSSKLKGCMELIHSLKDNKQKILLFSSFTSVLTLIEEQCQKEHVSYYRLDGSISKEKRKALVEKFQKDETTLFLISLKAGGSGLNLTSAQAVIHFDPWWNMSAKNQATDRAHRIGQTNSVQVFSLIMKNSIEEKIMKLQEHKKSLAEQFIEGHKGSIASMTLEDIQALFRIDS